MQLRGLLFLGLLLGAEAAKVVNRQEASPTDSNGDSTDTPVVSSTAPPPDASTTEPPPTSSEDDPSSTPNDDDTTVTRTTTVTNDDDDGATVTQRTTVLTTITSTVLVTVTDFETVTVTSEGETATSTIYETSTAWANMKRAIDLAPRTVGPEDFEVEARATAVPTVTQINWFDLELVRKRANNLQKRATVTEVVTVTVGGGDSETTVVNAQTRTVISTVSDETTVTSSVTETEAAGASTTVTTTSTLVVTSTAVTTGVVRTQTLDDPSETGGSGSGNSGGGSGGLSTGAKAGIGAGCGVAGLLVIGGLLWFCLRRRRSGPKVDADDMFGSSEVPVGSAGTDAHTPMAQQNRDTAANIITPRRIPTKPSSPEGYRGTAPGDGRAGFAKPQTFGAAYTNTTVSPETTYSRTTNTDPHPDAFEMQSPANTAELANDGGTGRWHDSNAAEIDGNQVRDHGTQPVYEMPAQPYK